MFYVTLFAFSGIVLILLIVVKHIEHKQKKAFPILKTISGNEKRLREIKKYILHTYSQNKEKIAISFKKQLFFKTKSLRNRTLILGKNITKKIIWDLRDSRLLRKRSDGMSEFFKNVSAIQKNNGEIHDVYEDMGEKMTDRKESGKKTTSPKKKAVMKIK